jgi:hypothetical protein
MPSGVSRVGLEITTVQGNPGGDVKLQLGTYQGGSYYYQYWWETWLQPPTNGTMYWTRGFRNVCGGFPFIMVTAYVVTTAITVKCNFYRRIASNI